MRKNLPGGLTTRRARGLRGLSIGLVASGVLGAACGSTTRDFGNALESGGAAGAASSNVQSNQGGAQSSFVLAGAGGRPESTDHASDAAGASGEAGELGGAGSAAAGENAGGADAGGAGAGGAGAGGAGAGGAGAGGSGAGGASGSAGSPGAGGAASASGGAGGGAGGAGAASGSAGGADAGGASGSPGVVPPSCAGLEANCGALATTNCCSAHAVPGGDFNRLNDTTPGYAATVSDFVLDDFEITVGRFRKFVDVYASSGKKPPAVGSGKNPNNTNDVGWIEADNSSLVSDLAAQVSCGLPYQTWTDDVGANENRPINCLSWYTAQAFCIWDGGRLPTLAEWSYAAVGGAQQRYYPWSKPPNDTTITASNASYDCMGDGASGCALTDLVPVGSKKDGVGRFLQADLSGNVSEWVQDWYIDTPPSPCKDCANFAPGTGKFRHFMGGSFEKNAFNQQTSGTSSTQPNNVMYTTGARCARN